MLAGDQAVEPVVSQARTAGRAFRVWQIQRQLDSDVDGLSASKQENLGRHLARTDGGGGEAYDDLAATDSDAADALVRIQDPLIERQFVTAYQRGEVDSDELIGAGLLAIDCSHPHKLYTVTPEGRDAAKISYREGIEHGEGTGDLGESTLHVVMVELGRRYVESAFVGSEDSSAVEAVSYYETDEYRLDAAGLDETGEVVVTVEAEWSNHDTLRAVPKDFDKMAAHDSEAAIWVVKNRKGAHDVLEALNDSPESRPRVEKEYSRNSPPKMWTIDTPGLTEVVTFQHLRDSVLDDGR